MVKYTKEFLIAELQRYVRQYNKVPMAVDINRDKSYPSIQPYKKHFGKWNNALIEAGLGVNRASEYSKEFLIAELQRYFKEFNEIPTRIALDSNTDYPSAATIHNYFGSFSDALLLAGMEPYHCGERHSNTFYELHGKSLGNVHNWKDYSSMSRFTFDKKLYPLIIGYELVLNNEIKTHMDHIFSRNEGFNQGIHPQIISHPANCQFLPELDNVKKGTRCDITLEQLKERIISWEIANNGNIKYYEYLFSIRLDLSKDIYNISPITGLEYTELVEFDWNSPSRYNTAKLLADSFGFELCQGEYTLKNLINAVNIIRDNYNLGIPLDEIRQNCNIDKYKNKGDFSRFMNQILGIKRRTISESNKLYKTVEHKKQNIKISPVTGIEYIISRTEKWNYPHKLKTAQVLAKAFNFELGNKETTLKNIKNAIEIIRWKYDIDLMSPDQIRDELEINGYEKTGRFSGFMKSALGITLKKSWKK